MNQPRLLRHFAALAALFAAAACSDSDERRAEEALLTADSEETGAQGLLSLNYEITSDVFRKWKKAQLALDRALGRSQSRSLKTAIIGQRPTREAIERAVARIQSNSRAKNALEQSGMSARHYVVATVALFQATRGIDPLTGEAFRGVPERNVEFAQRNREEIESVDDGRDFQFIADSVAAARAARGQTEVVIDTLDAPADTVLMPAPRNPTPIPSPMPATPQPRPTQPAQPTQPTQPTQPPTAPPPRTDSTARDF